MTADAGFSNFDLDDLLNQAADVDAAEQDQSSRKDGGSSSHPRRGLFSGRSSAARSSSSRKPITSSQTDSQPAAGGSGQDDQRGSPSAEAAGDAAEKQPSPANHETQLSKTPPKPVESPPELRPYTEGAPLPANSKFLRLACACGYRMRVKVQNAGKTVKCPKCESPLRVPATAARSGSTVHFRLEDSFPSKLSKIIAQFDQDAEKLKPNKTLSWLAFRSVRLTVKSISLEQIDTDRVREALHDLGESDDSRAFELLREAWEAEPGHLQSDILNAMGRSKDPRAIAFLLQMLTHHRSEIRLATVQSLGFAEDPRIVPALIDYGRHQPNQKYAVSDSLLKLGDFAVRPLLEMMSATDEPVLLTDLILILGRLKSAEAIKPLLQLLNTEDHSIKGYVAEALGFIGDPKSMTRLLPLLKSGDEKLRVQVATAFSRVPYAGCLKALVESLGDENLEVRKRCAAALGELGDHQAAPALVPLLKDPDTELRIIAAESLGRIGDQRAVPYLLKRIEDDDASVILKALGALRKIKDPEAAGALMKLLRHENSRIRQRTIDVLGQVGDAVVAERLEQILKMDRSEDVRAAAAKALGEIRDPGSVDGLIDALHDAFSIRCRAIVALGEIGDDAALPPLLAMLKDPAPEIRYHATQAIAESGCKEGIKNIQPLLDDSNAMVRRGAAKALESLGQGDADELLGSSGRQTIRRGLKQVRNALASLAPGTLADTIQHGSPAAKRLLGGVALVPIFLVAAYYLFSSSQLTEERVALMRRGNVSSIEISADGSTVVVGRTTGVVEIWDLPSERRKKILAPAQLNGEIIGVSMVPDSNLLVLSTTATAGGFDIDSGEMLWQISGHRGQLQTFIASNDRKHVMIGSSDGVFSFWDAKTGNPIGAGAVALPQDKTQETELSNNGQMLAGVGAKGPVTVWSTGTAAEQAVLDLYSDSTIVDMEFSADDQLLALSDSKGRLAVIDLNTQEVHQQVREPNLDARGLPQLFDRLRFNSEAGTLQGFLGARQLVAMNLSTGEVTRTEAGAPLVGNAFGTQPNGTRFALGQEGESPVYVFDRKNGQRTAVLDTD